MSDIEPPYRVLVVDDESSVRKALKWMLYANEYQVVECETGIEAKNILAEDPYFDVVISDISMPQMDGLSLLKYIKGISNCEVIMLTGKMSVETVVTAMKEGAFDYLTKPLDNVQECLIKIKHAAELHRLKESYQQLQASQKIKFPFFLVDFLVFFGPLFLFFLLFFLIPQLKKVLIIYLSS